MTPVFTHDCEACIFLGHYFGHDVYIHNEGMEKGTIIAREANDPGEYGSIPLSILVNNLANNTTIGGDCFPDGSMKYRDYIRSEYCGAYKKAMCAAMAELFGGTAINQKEQSNAL